MQEENCPHEDDIEYLKLQQTDGEPEYIVQCKRCNKKGIIHLVEDEEDWESLNK